VTVPQPGIAALCEPLGENSESHLGLGTLEIDCSCLSCPKDEVRAAMVLARLATKVRYMEVRLVTPLFFGRHAKEVFALWPSMQPHSQIGDRELRALRGPT